jgi:oxygen-independent coproporphyrinogen-3 oxidase
MTPRSAYVHVPFCRHRCGYCNFTLVAGRDDLIEPYLVALERELSWLGEPREVDTLFIGGGTPTHLPPDQFKRFLQTLARWHPLAASDCRRRLPSPKNPEFAVSQGNRRQETPPTNAEYTIEANPSDVDEPKLALMQEFGITRISLGAQSFNLAKLALLERDHNREIIASAIALARKHDLDVSLDLIFGSPGETLQNWQADLNSAIDLAPDHVSTYGLTFEQDTAFFNRLDRGELRSVDEELERDMYAAAIDSLTAAGFEHYEVSNFARPGKRCEHNEVYWSGGEYFAAGPGAARHTAGVREINFRSVTKWLAAVEAGESPVMEREELSAEDKARELLVFGLRRLAGVNRQWFADRTGFAIDQIVAESLKKFVAGKLLIDDGKTIRLTRDGLFISDSIWPAFLQD